jgi:phosphonate transport system substrate-binding protein
MSRDHFESNQSSTMDAHHERGTSPVFLFVLSVIAAAAIGWALWAQYFRVPIVPDAQVNLSTTGFNFSVSKLDPRFTDTDADMLADPPNDASKFIDPPTLFFAFVADEEPEKQKAAWKPFTDYLAKVTGKPVEYALFTNTKDQLKAMQDGKLQVAGFNTGSVPAAVNNCGFLPICAIPTGEGTALTRSNIIVPADSLLQQPADLKGHELTLTEPSSNSGYKAPLVLLRSNFGLQPLSDVLLRYSGSHEASIEGIAQKKYEAAAVAEDMLNRESAAGVIKPDQYRIIFSSESFPTAGLGYVYNLQPELAAKVKGALLTYDWKGTALEQTFSGAKQSRFIPVNYKNDWSLIRRIDDEMGGTKIE